MFIQRPPSRSGVSRGGPRRARRGAAAARRPTAILQVLEPRTLLAAVPIISEILASNSGGLADRDGDHPDWIELYNAGDAAVDLAGWSLTDDDGDLRRWTFPATILDPGGFLVVFASDKNRATAGGELHTNFKLGASGDYLALVRPDGSIASSFDPAYPAQANNVSYGVGFSSSQLVGAGATATVKVPTNGSLEGTWNLPSYSPDGSWTTGPTGVGYGVLEPGFKVHYVKANVGVDSLAAVDAVLANPSLQSVSLVTSADVINYVGTGAGANFSGDRAFPTQAMQVDFDDFFIDATGVMTIPTSGLWTFGVNSDDGFRLVLERDGQVLTSQFDGLRGPSDTLQTFDLTAGRWNVRLQVFEHGGGSSAELFAAAGEYTSFVGGAFRLVGDVANGGLAVGSVLEDEPGSTALVGRFVAGALDTLADGSIVGSWTSGATTAVGEGAPRLVKDALNGRSVVRFDASDGVDRLRIAAADNPLSGAGDFTAAVVFRTASPGVGGVGDWWANAGLIDAERPVSAADWGIAFDASGRIAAGIGDPNFDASAYSQPGLADGRAHLAVVTRAGGVLSIYIDGRLQATRNDVSTLDRDVADLVFGSIQTGGNGFTGDVAEIRLYDEELTASQVQRLATELDATYGLPDVTPSAVGTNVQGAMQWVNATAYVRIPFESPDPSQFDALTLRMRYDDGFVAYLNGVEVARVNADGAFAYNSTASASRDGDPLAVRTFSLTPYLSLLHAGTNLLAIRGLNASAGDDDFLVLPELVGSKLFAGQVGYFATPTPGAANANPYGGLVAPAVASVGHGFFTSPFAVSLSTATAGAEIRYTLDGSAPTATHGLVYSGPLTVSSTTTLRFGAFAPGWLSPPSGTETYLFLADVVQQSPDGSAPAGWPAGWVNGQSLDYGMDPDVVNSPTYGPMLQAALAAIPSISITTDLANLFDPVSGIYVNAYQQGSDWERPASIELINPDGSAGFQVNAGLRIRGGYSRSGDNPKHAFRLFFRGEYGASSLDFPLFGAEGADSFEKMDLRTAQNYSWSFGGDPNNNFIAEVFSRDTMRDMGQPYTRSRFYQLYINGQYWGLFQTEERPDANFGASYLGGDADDYDVIKVESGPYTTQATDGNFDAWNRLWDAVAGPDRLDLSRNAAYYQLQGKNPDGSANPAFENLVDVDNLIDYMLVILYGGNLDAPVSAFLGNGSPNNFFAIRDRTGGSGGFKFIMHDAEHTLLDPNENRNGPFPAGEELSKFNPQYLHQQLMANAAYRLRFADHVRKAFGPGGVLSPEVAQARFQSEADQIRLAIVAESARWGDAKRPDSPLTQADWQAAVDRILYGYMPYRTAIVWDQFRAAGLYPALEAPTFRLDGAPSTGGPVQAGSGLTITAPGGTIYYTTDGTDPRLADGSISPSAIAYNGGVTTSSPIIPGSAWTYLDGGVAPAAGWADPGFAATGWKTGAGEFGYGEGDESTVLDYGPDAGNKAITSYFRRTFSVADPSRAVGLTLRLKVDDGAVIYINGHEAARRNMPAGPVDGSTLATVAVGGGDESTFFTIELDPSLLVAGENVIAVEVHQSSSNSSDLSFDLGLDLTSSDAAALLLSQTTTLTARTLFDGQWSAVVSSRFRINVPAAAGNLAITEINYNPVAGPGSSDRQLFEFLELRNVGTSEIELTGVRFTAGITFDFTGSAITTLVPGAYVLIVKDAAAFAARYGTGRPVAGVYDGSLSNGGETLTLVDAAGATIESFAYGTQSPWPTTPNNGGATLVRTDPLAAPVAANWHASAIANGTPGNPDTNAPTISALDDLTIPEGSTLEVAFTIGDVETSAGSLAVTITADNFVLLPPGSLTLGGSGASRVLSIAPPTDAYGTATITVTVVDADGAVSRRSFRLTVTGVNDVPAAPPASYTLDEDGGWFYADAASGVLAGATDAEGDPITAVLEQDASHGWLYLYDDGSFYYYPFDNYSGPDSFTFRPFDGTDYGAAVTVSLIVNPTPDAPWIAWIGDAQLVQGETLAFDAYADDADLPDDRLTFSLDAGAPEGASIDPDTGAFTWAPTDATAPGVYAITVRVTDSGDPAQSATATFYVTLAYANRPPVLPALPDRTVNEGSALSFIVAAVDPDEPAQEITYTLDAGTPAGATIDPTTGAFSWTPGESDGGGVFTITVRATDSGEPSRWSAATFTITVAEINLPPVLAAIPDQAAVEHTPFSFQAAATDADLPAQTIRYSLAAGAPAGATIDAVTGVISWTPSEAQGGRTHAITVVATDSGAASASRTFRVAVAEVDDPPVLPALPDRTADAGAFLGFSAAAFDPDTPPGSLSYALAAGADLGASLAPTTGWFAWTPSASQAGGVYTFTIVVSVAGGPSDSATFTVRVAQPDRPPVIAAVADATIRPGDTARLVVVATDPDGRAVAYSLDPGTPAGATIDAATGTFSWTAPADLAPGRYAFTVRASDGALAATASFAVIVSSIVQTPQPSPIDLGSAAAVAAGGVLHVDGRLPAGAAAPFTASVDYGDGAGPVPLAVAADGTFALDHAYATVGSFTVAVRTTDASGAEFLGSLAVTVSAATVQDPAVQVASQSFASPPRGTTITLAFSGPLAPEAGDANRYVVVLAGLDGKFGTRDDRQFRPIAAAYDATGHVVTISSRRRIPAAMKFRVSIADGALHDRAGRSIDGDRDGSPGGGFSVDLGGRARWGPARRFAMPVRR